MKRIGLSESISSLSVQCVISTNKYAQIATKNQSHFCIFRHSKEQPALPRIQTSHQSTPFIAVNQLREEPL